MGELMGQQFSSFLGMRGVLPWTKNDVPPDRVRKGIHHSGRLRCLAIGMNSNFTEVVAESGFHERDSIGCERSPWRAQHFMHQPWSDIVFGASNPCRRGRAFTRLPGAVVAFRCSRTAASL